MATTVPRRLPLAERVPPHAWFVGSAVFHYLGPAFAVLLFARVGPARHRVAADRRRGARAARPGGGRGGCCASRTLLALGAVLARDELLLLPRDRPAAARHGRGDRVPAGDRAGRAGRAHAAQRRGAARSRWRGVYLLTGVRLAGEPLGFAFAFANAGLFALYIVLGHRVAQGSGLDGLAASMLAALVVVTPLAGWDAVPALDDPVAIAAGVGVGVASSVIPYVCDQLAMARLPRATYALLVSLLPATATVIGDRRPRPGPVAGRGAGRGAGGRRRGGPPRATGGLLGGEPGCPLASAAAELRVAIGRLAVEQRRAGGARARGRPPGRSGPRRAGRRR